MSDLHMPMKKVLDYFNDCLHKVKQFRPLACPLMYIHTMKKKKDITTPEHPDIPPESCQIALQQSM